MPVAVCRAVAPLAEHSCRDVAKSQASAEDPMIAQSPSANVLDGLVRWSAVTLKAWDEHGQVPN